MQPCIRSAGAAALAVLLLTLSPAALAQHADEDGNAGRVHRKGHKASGLSARWEPTASLPGAPAIRSRSRGLRSCGSLRGQALRHRSSPLPVHILPITLPHRRERLPCRSDVYKPSGKIAPMI